MPIKKLGKIVGNSAHDSVDIIKCGIHTIRASSIESVSDVFTPFATGAKSKIVLHTIGGVKHEELFETEAAAEAYRLDVLEAAFG